MFPTWPAKSEMAAGANGGAKKAASPKPPSGIFHLFCSPPIIFTAFLNSFGVQESC